MQRINAVRISTVTMILALWAPTAPAHTLGQTTDITVESQIVDGKLAWTPAVFRIANGAAVNLSVANRTGEPEAFEIPGLVEKAVIPPGAVKVFSFDADISGTYPLESADHPGAAPAKLIVLR